MVQAIDKKAVTLHALHQPVNVIRLTIGSIATRLLPRLGDDDRAYLLDKLALVEAQFERYTAITEQLEAAAPSADPT